MPAAITGLISFVWYQFWSFYQMMDFAIFLSLYDNFFFLTASSIDLSNKSRFTISQKTATGCKSVSPSDWCLRTIPALFSRTLIGSFLLKLNFRDFLLWWPLCHLEYLWDKPYYYLKHLLSQKPCQSWLKNFFNMNTSWTTKHFDRIYVRFLIFHWRKRRLLYTWIELKVFHVNWRFKFARL